MICQFVYNEVINIFFVVFRASHEDADECPVFIPAFLNKFVRIEHLVNRVFIHVSDIFIGNTLPTELTEMCLVQATVFSHPTASNLQYELYIDFFAIIFGFL